MNVEPLDVVSLVYRVGETSDPELDRGPETSICDAEEMRFLV